MLRSIDSFSALVCAYRDSKAERRSFFGRLRKPKVDGPTSADYEEYLWGADGAQRRKEKRYDGRSSSQSSRNSSASSSADEYSPRSQHRTSTSPVHARVPDSQTFQDVLRRIELSKDTKQRKMSSKFHQQPHTINFSRSKPPPLPRSAPPAAGTVDIGGGIGHRLSSCPPSFPAPLTPMMGNVSPSTSPPSGSTFGQVQRKLPAQLQREISLSVLKYHEPSKRGRLTVHAEHRGSGVQKQQQPVRAKLVIPAPPRPDGSPPPPPSEKRLAASSSSRGRVRRSLSSSDIRKDPLVSCAGFLHCIV